MAIVQIHPRDGADKFSNSEFGRVAAALDTAEAISWDRIGGPSKEDMDAVRRLETRLHALRPAPLDGMWLAGRLARAIVNGWDLESAIPLVRLVGDPLTVGCGRKCG